MEGYNATLDIGTQAGRENQSAIDAIAAAANNSAAAILVQTGSVDQSTAALNSGRDALRNQLAQFGITGAAADVYIGKLLATPAEIATQAKLAGIDEAAAQLETFIDRSSGRTITVNLALNEHVARGPGGGGGITFANGGVVDYFADGGVEDHTAQIAPAGSYRVWAEAETGGEAYIPLSPAKRARSLEIWRDTGKRLGVEGFADGGMLTTIWSPASSSSSGGGGATVVNNYYSNKFEVPMPPTTDPEAGLALLGREFGRRVAG
jgi:hypothetical protein